MTREKHDGKTEDDKMEKYWSKLFTSYWLKKHFIMSTS